MHCPACQSEINPGQKFCPSCGTRLAVNCAGCGAVLPSGARFCPECGTPWTEGSQPQAETIPAGPEEPAPKPVAERRLVSVLFADLVGFTSASETRDPEETREFLARYFELARERISRYGGTVEKFIGDAVMAVWGAPVAREDDAEQAVRAALDLVDAVTRLGEPASKLQLRSGVITGEAAVTIGAEGQGMVAGDLVNTASRLQGVALPGTVLVGEATYRAAGRAIAFEAAGEQALKGKAAPLPAWRALRVVAGRGGAGRADGLEPPFVGRDAEFTLLKSLFEATARERKVRLVSITGVAGIGKSRLAWEFEKYLDGLVDDVYWHQGRSPAYGEGVTFWALGEMVRSRAGIVEAEEAASSRLKIRAMLETFVDDEDERHWIEPGLLALLGLEESRAGERGELFAAWRTLFERISERGTTVLVFEDLQWADPGLVDFVEHMIGWSRTRPILVITLARPELLDRRASWGAGQRNFTSLHLEPLGEAAMRELLTGFVPGLPTTAVRTILNRADGIPLYAVETVRMLVAEGALVREGDAYAVRGALTRLSVPETLHALVAARLDALEPAARALVGDASILGSSFTVTGLAALTGQEPGALDARLASLVAGEVLRVEADPRSPERGQYQFMQAVTREVAYGMLSKRERRAKHLAAARYYESLGDDEIAGVLASHYLDAHRSSSPGPEAEALAVQARIALRGAADRAFALHSHDQALAYLEQALAVTTDESEQTALRERAAGAAQLASRYEDAERLLRQAIEWHQARGALAEVARLSARLNDLFCLSARVTEAREMLEPIYRAIEAADPPVPEATTAAVAAELARDHMLLEESPQAIVLADRALSIAERLDLKPVIVEALITKGSALGAERPREAIAVLSGAVELARMYGLARSELRALNNLGGPLEWEDPSRSITLARAGLELGQRLGHRDAVLNALSSIADGSFITGDWASADAAIGEVGDEEPPPTVEVQLLWGRWVLAAARGEAGEADRFERRLEELFTRVSNPQFQSGQLLTGSVVEYYAGRFGEAYRRAMAGASSAANRLAAHNLAGRAALRLGDLGAARAALRAAEASPERGRVPGAIAADLRAGVLALEGRADEAAGAYVDVMRQLRDLGLAVDLAICQLEFAALVGIDRPEARLAAEEARATLTRWGARALLAQLDALEVATPA